MQSLRMTAVRYLDTWRSKLARTFLFNAHKLDDVITCASVLVVTMAERSC